MDRETPNPPAACDQGGMSTGEREMEFKPAEMTDSELAQALKTASGERLAELTRERDERRVIRAAIRPYVPVQARRTSAVSES